MPDQILDQVAPVSFRFTPEQIRAASLAVCARSTDAGEAKELLSMLGLIVELKP